jgi:drug/metabolite transporter (DMT)-like permease
MAKSYIILALGVVSVSFAAVFIRVADAPPMAIATYRMCLAAIAVLPLGLARSGIELRRMPRRHLLMAILSGACLALHFGLWITSLSYASVATSVVLVTASPIFIAVASRFLFHQRLGRRAAAGIAITLAGAAVITYANWRIGPGSLMGGLLAFAAALAVAAYLLIGQRLRESLGFLSYASIVYSSAAVILLLVALARRVPLSGFSGSTYLMFLLLALLPQLVGHSSLNWALRFVPATFVAVAVLGEPVGATLWARLILDEVPATAEIVGGILILAGIFVAMRSMHSDQAGLPRIPSGASHE